MGQHRFAHPKRSDHFDGRRFFNPGVDLDKSLADLLRWRRMSQAERWPRRAPLVVPPSPRPSAGPGETVLTFIGHSTVLIETATARLLTDPVFSERASPVRFAGPRRVTPPGLALDALPRIDAILLSHNHYDHMDLASLQRLAARWHAPILTGLGNARPLVRRRIGPVLEHDWWESTALSPDLRITYVPAQHWSSRTVRDRRQALWGGHVVEWPAGRLFFAGDTGFGPHFEEIARRLGPPDIALLPIGAYEPRWFMAPQHMNPEDAVKAHLVLGARFSLGIHWGTFQLTDEAFDAPMRDLAAARAAHRVADEAFPAPLIGQSFRFGPAGRAGAAPSAPTPTQERGRQPAHPEPLRPRASA